MKDIFAGGLGGILFGVLYLALNIPLPFAVGGAVAGYVAGRLIVSKTRTKIGGVEINDSSEVGTEMIEEGERQVKALKGLVESVHKPEIRAKLQRLAEAAEKIIQDLKEKPQDAKRVRQFLNYYLGATCTILQRYTELSSRKIDSGEVSAALAKVEGMLDSIQRVFEQQLAAAAQDEILDLDTEIKLLEQTLRMESLNDAK